MPNSSDRPTKSKPRTMKSRKMYTLSVYLIVGGLAKLSEGLFSTPSYIGLGQVGFPTPSYFFSEEVPPTPSYLGLGVVPACGHHGFIPACGHPTIFSNPLLFFVRRDFPNPLLYRARASGFSNPLLFFVRRAFPNPPLFSTPGRLFDKLEYTPDTPPWYHGWHHT